jgi:hypothetical protein
MRRARASQEPPVETWPLPDVEPTDVDGEEVVDVVVLESVVEEAVSEVVESAVRTAESSVVAAVVPEVGAAATASSFAPV